MGVWVVGLELESGVVGGDGCCEVAFLFERITQVVMSIWVIGLQFYGFSEQIYKLIESALHSQDCSQVSIDNVIFCS